VKLKKCFALPALCTGLLLSAYPVAAADNSTDTGSLHTESAEQLDPHSVSDEAHKRAAELRTKIDRAERLQPDWNSAPMKAQLDRAISSLDSSLDGDSAFFSLLRLSCQTPLLDMELVKSADALFESRAPWCRAHNIIWFRSGNDTSVFLLWIPEHGRLLEQQLSKAETDHASPQTRKMRQLFAQCTQEFDKGDTLMADSYAWSLLKLAEESGDYRITKDILDWYHLFLIAMIHRPQSEIYKARSVYVSRETRCVANDDSFITTLNFFQSQCDPALVKDLRDMHTELVRRRRSGDTKTIKDLYDRFVDLAKKSGDRTCLIPYFALNVYHAYLETDLTTKNYDELRDQLYSAWVDEELGKQPSVVEENLKAGGDWKKIETAFESLEKQSIFVCRAVQRCHMWGESNPKAFWNERRVSSQRGMVYYEDFSIDKDLYLICYSGSEYKNGCLVDSDPEPVMDALMKSLIDAGFEANRTPNGNPGVVHVTGSWGKSYAARKGLIQ
jgi:hypothetical protein